MTTRKSIYTDEYERHHDDIIKVANSCLPFIDYIDELTYTILKPDHFVYEIPIKLGKMMHRYVDSAAFDASPLLSYQNLCLLPSMIKYTDLRHFVTNKNELDFLTEALNAQQEALLVFVYHLDGSISKLALHSSKPMSLTYYTDYYFDLKKLILRLYELVTHPHFNLLLPYFLVSQDRQGQTFNPESFVELTPPVAQICTASEQKILFYLYHHVYSAKEIARFIYLSHRTVEGKIKDICKKLRLKDKSELIAYAHSQHALIRYLAQHKQSGHLCLLSQCPEEQLFTN